MNVSKWNLKEFNSLQQKELIAGAPINSAQNPDQDNAVEPIILDDFSDESIDPQFDAKKFELEMAQLELEKSILEQNIITQNALSEIKTMLADIEKQQSSYLEQLSKNILVFIKNLTSKLLVNPLFSKTVTEVAVNHINDIIRKVKHSSSLNIIVPKDMSETVKSSLLTTFKSTASKLNIEVIEHEDDHKNIAVEWEDGKAELQLDNSIKIIEEELGHLDKRF